MPAQPTYRISYFPARGRAEVMRQILELAGKEYEDRRVEVENWPEFKPSTPFGQMPLLEVDGKMICQSNAGARYLAKTYGYYGANDWESAQIDMVVDCMEDTIKPVFKMIFNENEAEKVEQKKKLEEEQLPIFLGYLEKMLTQDYFVGNKLSLADLHVVNFLSYLDNIKVDFSTYPKIAALKTRVHNEPKLKSWIEKRPESEY